VDSNNRQLKEFGAQSFVGDDSVSGRNFDHRRTWIRDRLDPSLRRPHATIVRSLTVPLARSPRHSVTVIPD
jgi:hypothetical protein